MTRIPADIDREDPLVFGLSARQLCIFAVVGVAAWLLFAGVQEVAPAPLAVAAVSPLVAAGTWLAMGRRDGLNADRFALSLMCHWRLPHRLVPLSDDALPRRALRAYDGKLLAPMELPVRSIAEDGFLDLGSDGASQLLQVAPMNFTLRSADEQSALVAGFGRFLNSLHESVQIIVRSERADLSAIADEIERAAPTLPDPALDAAARSHAAFVRGLSRQHAVLHREVLLAVLSCRADARQSGGSRADALCAGLAEVGLMASRLDGGACAGVLQHAMTGAPSAVGETALPGKVVHGRRGPG